MGRKTLLILTDVVTTKQGTLIGKELYEHLSLSLNVHLKFGLSKKKFVQLQQDIMTKYDGILVIECLHESKILILIDIAFQMELPVFILCGDIRSYTSKGNYFLIRNGGIPVTSHVDILDHLT